MSEQVIWERVVDHDKIRERQERFKKWFGIPAVIILLVVLIFSGWQNAIGALIVLAVVGALWGTAVRYKSLSDQANPLITLNNGRLILGNRDVVIEDVNRYTTMATSMQTSLLGKHSRILIGKAVFRMDAPGSRREPKLIEFGWPNMDEDGVASVQDALEGVLGDKWVAPAELVTKDELPRRRRNRS